MISKEAIDLLLATGRGQNQVMENLSGEPFFIAPSGEPKGLKGFFPPRRIEQRVKLLDAGSFIDYVNRFKTLDSLIFSDVTEQGATLTAVIDYHTPEKEGGVPDWCRHIATFTTMQTPEWKAWLAGNRKPMEQVEFATWLEDNLHLFVVPKDKVTGQDLPGYPTPAELLELVRSLHGHQNARFNTALRLDNGAYSVAYDEDVSVKGTMSTRSEAMELPPLVCGAVSVFQGSAPYAVSARLKSRCVERKLVLWFETINLPAIVRESIMATVKEVGEKTGIVPLLGSAS